MKTTITEILNSLYSGGYEGALSLCLERIEGGKQTALFTPNSEIIYRASRSKRLLDTLNSAHILLPDGIGSYIGMKISGSHVQERTSGIELAEMILKESSKYGYRVFLLGGKKGVSDKAAKRLGERYKGLIICGHHHGYFEKRGKENFEIIKKINSARPDVLFVCFGFPEQEKWIKNNLSYLHSVKLAMGLGGSLDVWSGNIKRAPKFVSAAGFEWLWRICKDPKRLKRSVFLVKFSILLLKEALCKPKNFGKCYEIDNFLK